jgi:hypothetical protein
MNFHSISEELIQKFTLELDCWSYMGVGVFRIHFEKHRMICLFPTFPLCLEGSQVFFF